MENLIRCRVCGYIMKESRKSALCPACGVKRSAFEPYHETVSAGRRMVLNQHVHGITVNFPQALITLFFLSLMTGWFFSRFQEDLSIIVRYIGALLPLAVIGGIATGIVDGRTRFKRFITPIIRIKIITGILSLCVSIAIFILSRGFVFSSEGTIVLVGLSLCGMACGVVLGKLGASLVCTKVPG